MKKLTCEMCGSAELVKQDGFFVCQACETKYTVEEAKKMMIEGTVDVQGTVQVDKSNEIANRLENVKNEYDNGNMDNVQKLCLDILNIDPKNYTAIIYNALAQGWQSSVSNLKITKTCKELVRAIGIIRADYEDDTEYLLKAVFAMAEMRELVMSIIDMYNKYIEKQMNRHDELLKEAEDCGVKGLYDISLTYLNEAGKILDEAKQTVVSGTDLVKGDLLNLGIEVVNNIYDDDNVSESFLTYLSHYINIGDKDTVSSSVWKQYESLEKYVSLRRQRLKEIRIEKYWEEHKEEKESLEREKVELEEVVENLVEKISELENSKNKVSSIELLSAKEEEIAELEGQKKAIVFFKFKEKKAIQEKIGALLLEKDKIKTKVAAEQAAVEKEIAPIKAELNKANARIEEIDDELNMDREESEETEE